LGSQASGFIVGAGEDGRWNSEAEHLDRLPALTADLVGRKVDVIAATAAPSSAWSFTQSWNCSAAPRSTSRLTG
jgi:hypothetical protein